MQIYRVQHIIILLTAALFGSVSTVVGQQTPPRLLWAAETDEGIKLYGLFPDYTRIEIGALPDNVQISRQPQEGRAMYNNQGPDDVWSIPIPATMTVSPDGERLVYTAQILRLGYPDGIVFDEVRNKYLMTGLFLFNATNREHSSRMELNVAPYLLNLAWSPDGTNLLMSPMHLDYSGAEASLPPETFVTDFTGFHTLRSITNTPTQVDTDVFEWLDNETIRYRLQAVTTDGTPVPDLVGESTGERF